jgi:hypothetical protein
MKRALLAAAVLAPMIAAAYACQSDSFQNGDASEEGGGPITQADFCAAESLYMHQCGIFDAACVQVDLQNCGALYAVFTSGFAAAFTHCWEAGQLPCNVDLTKTLTAKCMSDELAGYHNDSGELASFAKDFCGHCTPSSSTCETKFASAIDQPGYLASLFSDTVIKSMDDCEKKLDASTVTVGDASPQCLNETLACELIGIALNGPAEACKDN